MKWPVVFRTKYDRDLADARAEVSRLRSRAERAEGIARTEVNIRRRVVERNDELDAANKNTAALERRIEQLQLQLDQALGLDDPAIKDGEGEHTRRPTKLRYDA
jgi:predicted RNase H-like nuclease (RuvC/YqgF family)